MKNSLSAALINFADFAKLHWERIERRSNETIHQLHQPEGTWQHYANVRNRKTTVGTYNVYSFFRKIRNWEENRHRSSRNYRYEITDFTRSCRAIGGKYIWCNCVIPSFFFELYEATRVTQLGLKFTIPYTTFPVSENIKFIVEISSKFSRW